jgi:MFS transporter, YNFM family, putative membrane transport protein
MPSWTYSPLSGRPDPLPLQAANDAHILNVSDERVTTAPGDMKTLAFRRVLWICGVCCFASMASLRACDALLPALVAAFHSSTARAAQTISLFALAYGLALFFFGPLGDRYGKVKVIAFATLACSVSNLMAATSIGLSELLVSRVISGAAAAGVIPLTMAWIGDNVAYEKRQEVLAALLGATVFGMIAGQWLSPLLANAFGWRAVFLPLAFIFLLGGTLALAAMRGMPHEESVAGASSLRRVGAVLSIPWARKILALTFVEGIFAFGSLAFIPTYLYARFGMSMPHAGAVVAMYGLGGLAYTRCAKILLRYMQRTNVARLGGTCLAVAYATLALSPIWQTALLACLLAGFGFHALHNTLQAHATEMAFQARGTAVSLFSCSLFLGQSLGIFATASLAPFTSLRPVFFCSGIGLLCASLILSSNAQWQIADARKVGNSGTSL